MSEPILKLKTVDKRVAALSMVKARAASRTRSRILQIVEAEKLKELETKLATGEAKIEEVDAIVEQTAVLNTPKK